MTVDFKSEQTHNSDPLNHEASPHRTRRLMLLAAFGSLFLVIAFLMMAEDTVDVSQKNTPVAKQIVSFEKVTVGPEVAVVNGFAEIRPRWSAELRSAVTGRVIAVTDSALAGEPVKPGEILIKIESSQYEAEVASAQHALEQARLAQRKAENNTAIARREFERAGTTPPSDLSLYLPELNIAESAVISAEARLTAAKRQLQDATVVAPFSGYVTQRLVSPGQTVNTGDILTKIVDDDTFELTLELGRRDWALLPKTLTGLKARLFDEAGIEITQASVRQGGGFLDETTRLYKVFLEVSDAGQTPLLSGDFVRVEVPGITVPSALNIPESALSQEGHFWHLDQDDRLQRLSPEILFRTKDRIVIKAPDGPDAWRIALTPLASFLPGQLVQAQESGR